MDPLFLGNAAAFIGILAASFLDLGSLFDGDDEDDGDDTPEDEAPQIVPLEFSGTEDADSFTSTGDRAAILDLLGGDDTVDAGFGNDTIDAGAGDDRIDARVGDDAVTLGDGDDTAAGGFGNDMLSGDAGDDSLLGESGFDFIAGGDGADVLSGGDADDTLDGGAGDDTLEGGAGADILLGGAGDDSLNGLYDDTSLSRTVDADLPDTIDGGEGDDTILIGAADTATGGAGVDRFIFDDDISQADVDGPEPAIITDFDPAEDVLQLQYTGDTPPELTIGFIDATDMDQAAAVILAEGQAVANLIGVGELTLSQIQLVQV